jgi:DNA-directed RNA polymerase subunit RPC12/RpoP
MGVIAMKCPNCGGKLDIYPEMSSFSCGYCGSSIQTQRRGGTVSLALEDVAMAIQKGTDKTAAELALRRLPGELSQKRDELEERNTKLQDAKDKNLSLEKETKQWNLFVLNHKKYTPIIVTTILVIASGVIASFIGFLIVKSINMPTPFSFVIEFTIVTIVMYFSGQLSWKFNLRDWAVEHQGLKEKVIGLEQDLVKARAQAEAAAAECRATEEEIESLVERIARNKAIADA